MIFVECNFPFKSIRNVLLPNLNSTCKVNERCIYDTFSTLHMVNDDEIVVAIDGVTGKHGLLDMLGVIKSIPL